jgi:hypothetical protein
MKSNIIRLAFAIAMLLLVGVQFSCQNNQLDSISPAKSSPFDILSKDVKSKIDVYAEAFRSYVDLEKINKKGLPDVETYINNYLKEKGVDFGNQKPVSSARVASIDPDSEQGLINEGYTTEFGYFDIPSNVRRYVDDYTTRLDNLAWSISDDDWVAVNQLSQIAVETANEVENANNLSSHEKSELLTIMYFLQGTTYGAYHHVLNSQWDWNSQYPDQVSGQDKAAKVMFFKKLFRAVARVLVAVVVTAVVVFAVVATAGAVGALIGAKIAVLSTTKALLIKGVTLGNLYASGVLGAATLGGIKNAEKNWNKPWQGWGEAFLYLKLKYNFCSAC